MFRRTQFFRFKGPDLCKIGKYHTILADYFEGKGGKRRAERVGHGEANRFTRRVKMAQCSLGRAVESPCSEPDRPFLLFLA